MEHNGIQYSTHTFHIPVDLASFTRPYRSQMYHVLANPNLFFRPPKVLALLFVLHCLHNSNLQ